ncbi:hypothetical protein ACFQ3Z_37340 [Streptomyces nogalater]
MPGLDSMWTCGWPTARISAVGDEWAALAVIGECGADETQLRDALPVVRAKGWRALTRWPGSYLVVARSGETLAVIGDLAGQHPVYYQTDAAGTWWATAASALAALDGAPVDVTALAAHLAFGQPDVLAAEACSATSRGCPAGTCCCSAPTGRRWSGTSRSPTRGWTCASRRRWCGPRSPRLLPHGSTAGRSAQTWRGWTPPRSPAWPPSGAGGRGDVRRRTPACRRPRVRGPHRGHRAGAHPPYGPRLRGHGVLRGP